MLKIRATSINRNTTKFRHVTNRFITFCTTSFDKLMKFCLNSSIHGLRYVTPENCALIDRIWWTIALGLSVFLCVNSICSLWSKWEENPVIISYSPYLHSIGTVPFPAMTVCPLAKISSNKFNYTRAYRNILNLDGNQTHITADELTKLKAVAQICDDFFAESILEKIAENDTDDHPFIKLIREISPGFEENIVACYMLGTYTMCHKYIHDIITEEGVCYAFNLLSPEEVATSYTSTELTYITQDRRSKHWNIQTGYESFNSSNFTDEFPYRTFSTGKMSSFKIILKVINRNKDYLCTGASQGFKFTFHAPFEVPQLWKKHFRVAPRQSANILVSPNVFLASEGLRSYRPEFRQCFFESERVLRYFRVYTQQNCELECLSNYTLAKCGCVKFSMACHNDTKICGAAKMRCCQDAENNIIHHDILNLCNCLPGCNSISYDVTMAESGFNLDEVFRRSALSGHVDVDNSIFSRITISFKEPHFRPITRSETHSFTDFLAKCGGLFGLFMGVSVLSIAEVFYYFIFRTSLEQKKQIKRYKKGGPRKK